MKLSVDNPSLTLKWRHVPESMNLLFTWCPGLNRCPLKIHANAHCPDRTCEGDIIENRVFADGVNLRWGPTGLGQAIHPEPSGLTDSEGARFCWHLRFEFRDSRTVRNKLLLRKATASWCSVAEATGSDTSDTRNKSTGRPRVWLGEGDQTRFVVFTALENYKVRSKLKLFWVKYNISQIRKPCQTFSVVMKMM